MDMHKTFYQFFYALIAILILLSQILGTLAGFPHGASLFGIALILLYLASRRWDAAEIRFLLVTFVVGGAYEGLAVHQEWILYQGTSGYHALPWWMLVSWMSLAILLKGLLRGLTEHPFRTLLLGLCVGPLFAITGEQMSLLTIPHPESDLKWIGLGWGCCFGLLAILAKENDDVTKSRQEKQGSS